MRPFFAFLSKPVRANPSPDEIIIRLPQNEATFISKIFEIIFTQKRDFTYLLWLKSQLKCYGDSPDGRFLARPSPTGHSEPTRPDRKQGDYGQRHHQGEDAGWTHGKTLLAAWLAHMAALVGVLATKQFGVVTIAGGLDGSMQGHDVCSKVERMTRTATFHVVSLTAFSSSVLRQPTHVVCHVILSGRWARLFQTKNDSHVMVARHSAESPSDLPQQGHIAWDDIA